MSLPVQHPDTLKALEAVLDGVQWSKKVVTALALLPMPDYATLEELEVRSSCSSVARHALSARIYYTPVISCSCEYTKVCVCCIPCFCRGLEQRIVQGECRHTP